MLENVSPRFQEHDRAFAINEGVVIGDADGQSPVLEQSDLQSHYRNRIIRRRQFRDKGAALFHSTDSSTREVGEVSISLGDSEGNSIARGVKNGGFGRFRQPNEISGEREEMLESEREGVLEMSDDGIGVQQWGIR